MRRRGHGDTEACYGNPGAPHRWDSGWATRETPAGLPVMSHFSLPMVDRHGLSPQHHTCQQECLQVEGRTNCHWQSSSVIFFTVHIIWTSFCGVCTWAVLVCLELSDRGTSTHGDQLCPKLHWLLKHQKDPQSLEWAAAGMPDRREEIYRPTLKQQVQLPLTKHLYVTFLSIQRGRILLSMTVCTLLYVVHIQNYDDSWVSEIWI